jgi:hypothetical protein
VKRTRKARARATQAQKLRNSAKGKVPKSALGEFWKGLEALPGFGDGALKEAALEAGSNLPPGVARMPTEAERGPGHTEVNEIHGRGHSGKRSTEESQNRHRGFRVEVSGRSLALGSHTQGNNKV